MICEGRDDIPGYEKEEFSRPYIDCQLDAEWMMVVFGVSYPHTRHACTGHIGQVIDKYSGERLWLMGRMEDMELVSRYRRMVAE